MKGDDITKGLEVVEGLAWIDDLEGQSNVKNTKERITSSISDYQNHYIIQCESAISCNDWK